MLQLLLNIYESHIYQLHPAQGQYKHAIYVTKEAQTQTYLSI